MYYWRNLTEKQRKEVLDYRRTQRYPKHSPPHFDSDQEVTYIITASCYEHEHIIGKSHLRRPLTRSLRTTLLGDLLVVRPTQPLPPARQDRSNKVAKKRAGAISRKVVF